jgi:ketosteroid isomerase-like protein
MSQEADNVALLKRCYQKWSDSRGGSVDDWMAVCADNIKFGSIAEGPSKVEYLTAYSRRDALATYFEGLKRDWEMIEYVTEHFIAQGDRVVMLGRCSWRFKKTGKVVSTPKADSWRFANGKAVEYYEYYDTAKLRDAIA